MIKIHLGQVREKNIDTKGKIKSLVLSILKNEYGIKKPVFTFGKNGKPYTKDVFFNSSDSKEYYGTAFSTSEVGIDLEKIRKRKINPLLLNKIANEKDLEYLKDDSFSFLLMFTIKEAYLKYIGVGIFGGLKDVKINYENGNITHPNYKNAVVKVFTNDKLILSIVSDAKQDILFLEEENNEILQKMRQVI